MDSIKTYFNTFSNAINGAGQSRECANNAFAPKPEEEL
jgi:hypothetical protein